VCLRSSQEDNAKLADRTVNQSLKLSSQVKENMRSNNDAAQNLAENHKFDECCRDTCLHGDDGRYELILPKMRKPS
jgi:hypothetical protein